MSYIHLVDLSNATEAVHDAYRKAIHIFTKAYGDLLPEGMTVPVPDVCRACSQVGAYCAFTAQQLDLMTEGGDNYLNSPDAKVPRLVPCFTVANFSSCFY